ncbi:hypothetical protein I552_2532 [Mycobacterium xenopi 3993]|nr:hypothetical protein I552_2532 [Mycobacterium xenopi 3993]
MPWLSALADQQCRRRLPDANPRRLPFRIIAGRSAVTAPTRP